MCSGWCRIRKSTCFRAAARTTARLRLPMWKRRALPDFVGSTSAIMDYAQNSDSREFLIGTEISIAEHLQYDCPGKRFYPLTTRLICPDMKATTLADVYALLSGEGDRAAAQITMDAETMRLARRCIDEMIRLG